jgi:hypothetical protein
MSLTKRQKILSGVFLLGVAGLVADRTILRPQGGPQAASADSLPVAPSAVPPSNRGPATEAVPEPPSVAERLNNLLAGKETGPDEPRDPFSLPATWSDTAPADGERTPDTIRGFVRTHQLKAIVMQGGQSCAQVDDSFLVPGQCVDGFTLVSVDHRSAVFEREGKRAVLDLVIK